MQVYDRIGGGAVAIGGLVFLVIVLSHRDLSIDLLRDPFVLVAVLIIGAGSYAYLGRPYARSTVFLGSIVLGLLGFVAIWGSLLAVVMLICAVIALGSSILKVVSARTGRQG